MHTTKHWDQKNQHFRLWACAGASSNSACTINSGALVLHQPYCWCQRQLPHSQQTCLGLQCSDSVVLHAC
jgi:hypothetical protein